jgi:hypothetical protein
LTTGTSKVEFFATDSAIVDESGNLNIIISALTSLVIRTEAPAIGLAIFVDGEGIVTASGDSNSVDTWTPLVSDQQCERNI